jgi:hypothetical protein
LRGCHQVRLNATICSIIPVNRPLALNPHSCQAYIVIAPGIEIESVMSSGFSWPPGILPGRFPGLAGIRFALDGSIHIPEFQANPGQHFFVGHQAIRQLLPMGNFAVLEHQLQRNIFKNKDIR